MPQVKKTRARPAPQGRPVRRAPASRPRKAQAGGWTMKLGAWAHAQMRQVEYDPRLRTAVTVVACSAVAAVFVGVMVASGMARDLGNGIAAGAAGASRAAGLSVQGLDVQAQGDHRLTDLQRREAAETSGLQRDDVMFSVSPRDVRDRLMSLPWVESVTVRRLWPDRVQILIEPRPAVAVWQKGGTLAFIDAAGRLLAPASTREARGFAIVVGDGAPAAAPALFADLARQPAVARATQAAQRIGGRRWTLQLRSGGEVLLPETGQAAAIAQLAALEPTHGLLTRYPARLDLRVPDRLIIRQPAEAAASTPTGGV